MVGQLSAFIESRHRRINFDFRCGNRRGNGRSRIQLDVANVRLAELELHHFLVRAIAGRGVSEFVVQRAIEQKDRVRAVFLGWVVLLEGLALGRGHGDRRVLDRLFRRRVEDFPSDTRLADREGAGRKSERSEREREWFTHGQCLLCWM